ncbi:hypothetical protein [Streptomyces sp. NPDC059003]|uniref:hypothetical protein n=1 Tax=Streptomyces sp. NPDC059003 TaxID=3346691 RepID=UPI0036B873A4
MDSGDRTAPPASWWPPPTTDPATPPDKATWYLATSLPRPGSPRAAESPYEVAGLDEIVWPYDLRNWTEQSYQQVKDELGWADFQVRSDAAIRRHQALVNCTFNFCWTTWFTPDPLTSELEPFRPREREHSRPTSPGRPVGPRQSAPSVAS